VTIPSIVRNVWWAAKRAIVAIVWDSIESSTPAYAGCFPCGDSNSRRVSSYRSRITGHSSIQIRPNHRGRDRLGMPPERPGSVQSTSSSGRNHGKGPRLESLTTTPGDWSRDQVPHEHGQPPHLKTRSRGLRQARSLRREPQRNLEFSTKPRGRRWCILKPNPRLGSCKILPLRGRSGTRLLRAKRTSNERTWSD